jgi:uncharacterized protein (DUF488 family)
MTCMAAPNNTIYTIGHSNRTAAFFIEMLRSFNVRLLTDVRSMPGSKWVPQFNSRTLADALDLNDIKYVHCPALGGRIPKTTIADNMDNTRPFANYSNYMKTEAFANAIKTLQHIARNEKVAYMCAEADWRQCHRSIISEYLALQGWEVVHIIDKGKCTVHVANIKDEPIQGNLF